jgi:hypothetical protein
MLSSSTLHAWSDDDELGLTLDEGPCSTSAFHGFVDKAGNPLDGNGSGSMIEADGLGRTCSTGGVMLRGGGAKYDLFLISQNETNSEPSSIAPFNLIPYLK